jgi:hypothetical protein
MASSDSILRWTGTTLCIIGIALTSFNVYPSNIVFGIIGSGLWAWVGLRRHDYALLIVEFVAVLVYLAGFIHYVRGQL